MRASSVEINDGENEVAWEHLGFMDRVARSFRAFCDSGEKLKVYQLQGGRSDRGMRPPVLLPVPGRPPVGLGLTS